MKMKFKYEFVVEFDPSGSPCNNLRIQVHDPLISRAYSAIRRLYCQSV